MTFERQAFSADLRRLLLSLGGFGLQIAVTFFVAYFLLGGRARDLHAPLRFGGDSAAYLMQTKTTLEHGWWWSNPRLAAPSTLNNLLWPSHSNVDQALIKAVGLVTRETGFTVNVTWLLMLGLSGAIATYGLRLLGVGVAPALVMGTLFALSPFAISQNLGHFMLVTYLVPFSATLAVLVAAGRSGDIGRWALGSLYLGCALTGLNYAYYSLFGSMLLSAAVLAALLSGGRWRALVPGTVGIVAIALATLLSVLPSFGAWDADGRPATIREKVPAEAEVYGLKVRHLLSPVRGQTFAPLAAWNRIDAAAGFPLETENTAARLGLVAAAGLLAGLGCVLGASRLRQSPRGQLTLAAGQLTIAGILLATIGGFGALFNLFIAPDIRAYSRIAPFLAFFALFVVAAGCDAVFRRSPVAGSILLALLLAIGLWDQHFPFMAIRARSAVARDEYRRTEALVRSVEAELPRGSMVLQLPFVIYFNEPTRSRQAPYDSFKPYLVSQHLRWSYAALSNRQLRWQQSAMKVATEDLPAVMTREGFVAILVDRYAYEDAGASVLTRLRAAPGVDFRWADERYTVIDIRSARPPADRVLPEVSGEARPATAALPACANQPLASIEYVGGKPGPFNVPVSWPANRDLRVSGWIVPGDKSAAAAGVDASLDGTYIPVYYGFPRPDVAGYVGGPAFLDTGFVADVPAALLTSGSHSLTFRAASQAGACAGETPPVVLAVR